MVRLGGGSARKSATVEVRCLYFCVVHMVSNAPVPEMGIMPMASLLDADFMESTFLSLPALVSVCTTVSKHACPSGFLLPVFCSPVLLTLCGVPVVVMASASSA